jgi:hypothetical protein
MLLDPTAGDKYRRESKPIDHDPDHNHKLSNDRTQHD